MMKNNILFTALACVALLFTSCDDEFESGNTPAVEKFFDQEVSFGGSASYNLADKQKAATRTIYGGYKAGATAEPVYWLSTDQVRLFCNESSIKSADYKVTVAENEKTETNTGLDKITDAGLRWGNPESQHTFYGVYPIPTDNSLKESTVLTGTIPAVQDYKEYTTTDGSYVFAPDMDYAYMVAKTYVKTPNDIGENVYLKFAPIATAVEIELYNDATDKSYNFREIHLSSETHYLSGSFTANLDNMTLGEGDNVKYATGCPTSITYGDDKSKQAAVRLYVDGNAATLAAGKTLKFTLFMLPSSDGATDEDAVNDLKVTLVTSEGNKTGTLSGIKIKKSKKTYMHKMPIGGEMTYNQSEWLKYVDDEKKLNELSIPGAGGAASGNVFAGSSVQDYLEQSLSIEDLWNVGIRCFEFTVDYDKTTTGETDLGGVEVYCNAQETDLTLNDCVGEVKRLLGEHPKEFAMVIITYQQQGGWDPRANDGTVTYNRKPATFMSQLNTYWSAVGANMPADTKTALYNSTMTVDEARGSLFCIARPSSQGEDNFAVVSTTLSSGIYKHNSTTYSPLTTDIYKIDEDIINPHEDILVIHGWGALKDKWFVRGYTDCIYFRMGGNCQFDYAINEDDKASDIGYRDDRTTKPGRPFDVSTSGDADGTLDDEYSGKTSTSQLTLTPNFYYSTLTNSGTLQTNAAWVQEWARVSSSSTHYRTNASNNNHVAYWLESKTEKEKNILDCLERSLNKESTDCTIYINSLCGYYIINGSSSIAVNSASPNQLTEGNLAYSSHSNTIFGHTHNGTFKYNVLTGANNLAGMCGNIGTFASEMNEYFLTQLNGKLSSAGRLAGSTGIVLMDRVTDDANDAGAKIPSIIIANNFAPDQNAASTSYSIRTSNLEDDDAVLSNGYRGVVWGEWEK